MRTEPTGVSRLAAADERLNRPTEDAVERDAD